MSSNNLLDSELEDWADQPHSINLSQVRLICEELIESRSQKLKYQDLLDAVDSMRKGSALDWERRVIDAREKLR